MNIVIMGGGKVGESLARRILEGRRHEVRIIESDRARSLQLANAKREAVPPAATDAHSTLQPLAAQAAASFE